MGSRSRNAEMIQSYVIDTLGTLNFTQYTRYDPSHMVLETSLLATEDASSASSCIFILRGRGGGGGRVALFLAR